MNIRFIHVLLAVVIAGLVGYYIGSSKISYEWKNYKPHVVVENKKPPPGLTNVDFSLFWNVWSRLESQYYDKSAIDGQKLLNGAITGMVQALGDPYTVYLPPTQNKDFKQGLAGEFEGIGAELGIKDKQIIVVAPLDGTPAQKAGIKAGDAILKVDGKETFDWTIGQAVEKIRGPKGTKVTLTVLHKNDKTPKDIEVTRGKIMVKSVTYYVKKLKDIEHIKLDKIDKTAQTTDSIAYIRLSQFGDATNKEWVESVNGLVLKIGQDKKIRGIILDLRNNPGGYLGDATFIASEFIRSGTVVIQERGSGDRSAFSVSRKGLLLDTPVVVLINKGSASASEIVAGALRDHKRAKLVGEQSFGKGTIQEADDLGDGAGIHITVAKWLTPNGGWVHGKGLEPDVKVELNEKEPNRDLQLEKAVEELVK